MIMQPKEDLKNLLLFLLLSILYYWLQKKYKNNFYIPVTLYVIVSLIFIPLPAWKIFGLCLLFILLITVSIGFGTQLFISGIFIFITLFMNSAPSLLLMIPLIIFQAGVVVFATSQNKSQRIFRFVTIGLVAGISILFYFVIPFIKMAIKIMLSFIIQLVAKIISPIMVWIFSFLKSDEQKEGRLRRLTGPAKKKYMNSETMDYSTPPYIEVFLLIFIGIMSIFLIVYVIKKIRVSHTHTIKRKGLTYSQSIGQEKNKLFNRERTKPPTNQIRRAIYKMEKAQNNDEKKRIRGETLRGWLSRTESQSKGNLDYISDVYERVRYGDESITAQEVNKFKEILKIIRAKKQG